MPSREPFLIAPPSQSVEEETSPSARPGSKWGGHVGWPETMEWATHNDTHKPSHPVSEGEKDSGFSDGGSEYLSAIEQTDAEGQAASPLPPRPANVSKARGGFMGSTFPSLTPVYLVNNVILKQTLGVSPTAPFLPWSSQRPLEGIHSPAAHVLIQEPVVSLTPLLPGQKRSAKDAHFPSLGTYFRIDPYSSCSPQAEEAPSPVGDPSKHQWFCRGQAPISKDSLKKPPKEPLTGPEVPPCPILPARTGPDAAEGRVAFRASKRLGSHDLGRQRRLQNTVEILRRSGLLGITLRTKELLRQNSSTQRELAEVREHARLLCEAVRSNDSRAWAHLQDAISCSAAYWPCKGIGTHTRWGQQQNLAAQPTNPLLPRPGEHPSSLGLAFGRDTTLAAALP